MKGEGIGEGGGGGTGWKGEGSLVMIYLGFRAGSVLSMNIT